MLTPPDADQAAAAVGRAHAPFVAPAAAACFATTSAAAVADPVTADAAAA